MQRLFFEKQIDLNHALQELISVSVNENLAYQDDPEGKRAVGTLEISGEYLRLASRERFNDQIEIDVLAPFERLEDNENFHLEIQDFDYHIQNGNLNLEIQVLAHGVGEKKERHIIVEAPDENEQAMLQEIQNIVSQAELSEAIEEELNEESAVSDASVEETAEDLAETEKVRDEVEEVQEAVEEIVPVIQAVPAPTEEMSQEAKSNDDIKRDESPVSAKEEADSSIQEDQPAKSLEESEKTVSFQEETRPEEVLETGNDESVEADWQDSESVDVEDLFDDEVMAFVTYPIYVVQPGDSYERIAQRYQMDAETLMDYNQHVSLKPHQLLIIPPR